MLYVEGDDVVFLPRDALSRLEFVNADGEGCPLNTERHRFRERLRRPAGTVQVDGIGPVL